LLAIIGARLGQVFRLVFLGKGRRGEQDEQQQRKCLQHAYPRDKASKVAPLRAIQVTLIARVGWRDTARGSVRPPYRLEIAGGTVALWRNPTATPSGEPTAERGIMKVGFVGLGIMGRPMAHNLIKGGHELFVYGKRTVPPEIRDGATVCDTLKAVAAASEVIVIMVPDTPDVRDVLFSADGVAAGLKPGKTIVDMSSISPIETKVFAAEIVQKGCDYVDAPVSGGEVGAKAASLTIMVGGSEAAFNRVKPLFELMGKNI